MSSSVHRSLRRSLFALVLAGVLVFSEVVFAGDESLRVVCIASTRKQEVSERLAEALESQLTDLNADLRLEWVDDLDSDPMAQIAMVKTLTSGDGVDLVIWVKNLDTDAALLYIAEMASENTLLRVLYFEETDREIRYESIAYVVRSVARAVSGGGGIGVVAGAPPREAPEATAEEPAEEQEPVSEEPGREPDPAPAEEPGPVEEDGAPPVSGDDDEGGRGVEVSVTYVLLMHSPQVPTVHAVRSAVALGLADWARPYVAYRAVFPFEASSASASVAVTHHPLEIGWSSVFRRGNGRLGGGVGFSADKVTWSVESLEKEIAPVGGDSRWVYSLSPFVCASWAPTELFGFYLAIGAEVVLNKWGFVVETANGTETLDATHRVSGFVQAGFEFVFY